ncbi:hypothetical protein [Acidocella sp.]|jgi:cytochrome c peroxidase|uniref:hypothetical protein n=1 Tax=Acidocella sp. TaxID=50710 RepID=UPI002F4062CF
MFPLTSPFEMDGGGVQVIAAKLQAAPYVGTLKQLFGDALFSDPSIAVARYQIED